ncbi:MAG: class I SAM-dependent methyltransferase, partial [Candidatus Aenigmarchaeota archaeon]|nr:class I SAM-dependent methyltransferase [Candidatus Aenigmarchaeota archaeon]
MKKENFQSKEKEQDKDVLSQFGELAKSRFMYRQFIDGLIRGRFEPLSDEKIDQIIEENSFSFPALIALSKEQEILLKKHLFDHLKLVLNRREFKLLCGKIHHNKETNTFFSDKEVKEKYDPEAKSELFTLKDKLKLFDPSFWINQRLQEARSSGPLKCWGNRELKRYGFSDDDWKKILSKVRQTTNKKKLKILDIGCGMGLALQDIKAIDRNVETYGITCDQEPGMYQADKFYYLNAERMPVSFKNKFDIIISNISFRYFLFPHIALKNTILSLSKGGRAEIAFAFDRIPCGEPYDSYFRKLVPEAKDSYQAMKKIMFEELAKLKLLQKKGKIKITIPDSFQEHCQGWLIVDKVEDVE